DAPAGEPPKPGRLPARRIRGATCALLRQRLLLDDLEGDAARRRAVMRDVCAHERGTVLARRQLVPCEPSAEPHVVAPLRLVAEELPPRHGDNAPLGLPFLLRLADALAAHEPPRLQERDLDRDLRRLRQREEERA